MRPKPLIIAVVALALIGCATGCILDQAIAALDRMPSYMDGVQQLLVELRSALSQLS